MDRPFVVIPADSPSLVGASPCLAQLQEIADYQLYSDRPTSTAQQIHRVQSADILLNSRGSLAFPSSILQQLPRLRMIAVCGIGYDAIDLAQATRQGIVVCNVPGRTAPIVAEHALGLMLAVARRMSFMTAQLRAGQWRGDLGLTLSGRCLGVIGTGHIGCEMLRLTRAIGMRTIAWSLHPDPLKAARLGFEYVAFDELLQTADVVSLHTRLSPQTRQLIGAAQLAQMRPSSILINTSRGAIVDTQALTAALNSGHLFGAGLDVFDHEPLPHDHPLLSCANVVLTPHCADTTQQGLDQLTLGCIDNIRRFLQGSPQNVVNPEVLHEPPHP
ncbi:MAG: Glycerate dehydrogenase [Planctomycetota bacterium]|jgi:D-3-phosphoglycerate dehydrogenase